MGHSQSYDLRNPETGEKTPVRGVRRTSKEHQADLPTSTENVRPFDLREEELRERIRREQLKKQGDELDTVRIRKHESREPIIDAYRPSQVSPQAVVYREFNHYDSLKHPSPASPNTYLVLKRRPEVNEGNIYSFPSADTRYDQVPIDPSPQSSFREVPRQREIPVTTASEYPNRSSVFNGRVSPLPLQEEVDPHPMPRYIPPMSPRYDGIPEGTHYSKTTTTTTYTISRSASVPRFDAPPVPPSPKPSKTYSRASKLQKYDEVPRSPRPTSMYSKLPEKPRVYDIPISPIPSSNYSKASSRPQQTQVLRSPRPTSMYSQLPQNHIPTSPRPSSTYSKASNLTNNVPTRYARGTEVLRYSELHVNPSGHHTYSRASKLPKYDEVPRSTMFSRTSNSSKYEEVPRSPSLHSLRVPTYDEVPYQKSTRSVTPVYIPAEKTNTRVRIVPVQTSPPVPKPPIHLTPLQPEVSRIPLNNRSTYVPPSPVESRSDSPAIVIIPFSSSSSMASSPKETPIYRTLVKPPRPSKERMNPLEKESYRSSKSVRERSRSMDKITVTSYYRATELKKSDPKPAPRKVEKLYLEKRQKEVPWVPMDQCISPPIYSTPPDSDEEDIVIIPFSNIHSPQSSVKSMTPPLRDQKEVSRVPLTGRPIDDTPPSPVIRRIITPVSATPPPPRTPSPKLHLIRLEREVPGTPIERYVNRRRSSTETVVPTSPPLIPSKMFLLRRSSEVSRCPLDDHVAKPIRKTPTYSSPSSPISIRSTPSPPQSPVYVTRRASDIRKTPIGNYVTNEPSSPPLEEVTIIQNPRSAPPPSVQPKFHETSFEKGLRKTPIENYVRKEAPLSPRKIRSPPPNIHETSLAKDLRSTPLHHYIIKEPVHSTPSSPRVARDTVPTIRTSPPILVKSNTKCHLLHVTSREREVPWAPLRSYVRTGQSYSPPPSEDSLSRQPTPRPTVYTPPRTTQTKREQEIKKNPLHNDVSRPIYSTPPFEDKQTEVYSTSSSSRSSPRSPRMPPKMHLTHRHSEVPYNPLNSFVSRSPTPTEVILKNSLSEENKPENRLDPYPKSFTKVPGKVLETPNQGNARRVSDPRSSHSRPPSTASSIVYNNCPNKSTQTLPYRSSVSLPGTVTLPATVILPASSRLALREREVSRVPHYHRPSQCRPSTIINIYSTPIAESPTHLSELHAEKRMIVGIDDMEKPENITYVTVATSSIDDASEALHRHPEVGKHPVYVAPTQYSYERKVPLQNKQNQYSRRSSGDSTKVIIPKEKCDVENCTHVEVNDETPIVSRRRISQDVIRDKENRLTIYVNEDDLENVVELAQENDGDRKKCYEERLHYDAYMPTLSLGRRPIVSFYDKLP